MKQILTVGLGLLLGVCLTGMSGPAPILPTTDFYVNDAAGILADPHKETMMSISAGLEEEQGIQLVVLTVPSLESMGATDPDALANLIFESWEIGGRQEENGILILGVKEPASCAIRVGETYAQDITFSQAQAVVEEVIPMMRKGNSSKALMELYSALTLRLYDIWGVEPPAAEGSKEGVTPSYFMFALMGVALIVVASSFRVSSKYRKKYGSRYARPRKSYSATVIDDEMREARPMPDYFNEIGRRPTLDGENSANEHSSKD